MGYTWRSDSSSFWPGQLDFVIYSDSVLSVANSYVLYTPEITDPASLGLQSNDSRSSDHLLFCSDFAGISSPLLGDVNGDGSFDLLDIELFVQLILSGNFQDEAEINGDDAVDLLDIAHFVDLLAG